MFEQFTDQARAVVTAAHTQARRLGHNYVGCEHLLLAAAGSDDPAGSVLRGLGLTPEAVDRAIVDMMSSTGRAPTLDRDALAVIGIDLDMVRDRVEAAFGPGALTRPSPSTRRRGLFRRRRRCYTGPASGHRPFTPRAKKCLERSLREALTRGDNHVGVEHIALALTAMTGIAPRILDRLGIAPAIARRAILNRYRQAS